MSAPRRKRLTTRNPWAALVRALGRPIVLVLVLVLVLIYREWVHSADPETLHLPALQLPTLLQRHRPPLLPVKPPQTRIQTTTTSSLRAPALGKPLLHVNVPVAALPSWQRTPIIIEGKAHRRNPLLPEQELRLDPWLVLRSPGRTVAIGAELTLEFECSYPASDVAEHCPTG